MSDIGMGSGQLGLLTEQMSGEVMDAVKKANSAEHQVEKGRIPPSTLMAISEHKKPTLPDGKLKFSKSELMAMIQKLMIANLNQQSRTQSITTKATGQRIKNLAKQNIKKLEQVRHKTHQSNVGGIVAQVFAWIAAAITVVASVVLAVVSFGAGSELIGCALIAAAALTIAVTVLTQTGVMNKIASAIAKPIQDMLEDMGVSKKAAKIASQIAAQIVIAVAIIAVDIGLMVASGGASSEEVVSTTVQKLAKIASVAAKVAQSVSAVAEVGSASAQVASATFKYQGAIVQANMDDNKAYVKRMQIILGQEQDTLRQLVASLSTTYVRMDDMMKSTHKANAQMLSQWASA